MLRTGISSQYDDTEEDENADTGRRAQRRKAYANAIGGASDWRDRLDEGAELSTRIRSVSTMIGRSATRLALISASVPKGSRPGVHADHHVGLGAPGEQRMRATAARWQDMAKAGGAIGKIRVSTTKPLHGAIESLWAAKRAFGEDDCRGAVVQIRSEFGDLGQLGAAFTRGAANKSGRKPMADKIDARQVPQAGGDHMVGE
ncbi:hypothetical protein GQR58_029855 [Nymphon striatum]|nr:hypothetical protein GQR58_029855 [Nymphon striatum]